MCVFGLESPRRKGESEPDSGATRLGWPASPPSHHHYVGASMLVSYRSSLPLLPSTWSLCLCLACFNWLFLKSLVKLDLYTGSQHQPCSRSIIGKLMASKQTCWRGLSDLMQRGLGLLFREILFIYGSLKHRFLKKNHLMICLLGFIDKNELKCIHLKGQ